MGKKALSGIECLDRYVALPRGNGCFKKYRFSGSGQAEVLDVQHLPTLGEEASELRVYPPAVLKMPCAFLCKGFRPPHPVITG